MSRRRSRQCNLYWAFIGAVLGDLLAGPMEAGKGALFPWLEQERAPHGEASASHGDAGICPKVK